MGKQFETERDRAEYWKQRAKSAEGHLFASDFKAAVMALHACTNFESTPWDELSGCQLGKLYRATGSVIRVVNAQRCTRAPNDSDSEEVIRALNAELDKAGEDYDKAWRHDLNDKNNYQVLVAEVSRLSRLAEFWRSRDDLPQLGVKVLVLCDAGVIGNPHHIGHRSGRWVQQSEMIGTGFMCEVLSEGRVIGWAPFSEFAGSKDLERYQFIADSACDVSFYVANTDCGDGDTTPGPRVELTPDQYPVEMFGTGKAKLDFAVDALMMDKEVATPSTDTEDVSRHEGGQT